MNKKTYVKTHLIQAYTERELKTHIGSVTLDAFSKVKQRIVESLFDTQ